MKKTLRVPVALLFAASAASPAFLPAGNAWTSDWPEGSAAMAQAREGLAAPRQASLDESLSRAVARKDLDEARRLLDEGADPNSGGWPQPMTPFQLAFYYADAAMIDLLLARGGSVLPMRDGDSAVLALLAYSPMEDVPAEALARRLIDLGSPVQNVTYYMTPLMAAAASGRLWLVRLLLDRGADPNFAAALGGKEPLSKAVEHRRKDVLRLLLERGAVPGNGVAGRGSSPLLTATIYGDAEVVGLLLDHGADPNDRWGGGDYVIHSALCKKDVSMLRLLIRRGARLDARDIRGNTPLHIASVLRIPDCFADFELLIAEGAPIDAANDEGVTPLMFAASWGHRKTAEALLKAGASKDAKDNSGNTAESYARKNNRSKLYDLLKPAD